MTTIAPTTITTPAKHTTIKSMFSVDWLAHITGVLAVVFTAAGAGFGLASWYFSKRVSERKETELARFQEESKKAISAAEARAAEANRGVAEAYLRATKLEVDVSLNQARAAKAELELAEVRRKQGPRKIMVDTFTLLLKERGKFNATVELVLPKDPLSTEPQTLASEFWSSLNNAGWKAGSFIKFLDATSQEASWVMFAGVMPPAMSVDSRTPEGVTVIASSINPRSKALEALYPSLQTLAFGVGLGIDSALGADAIRIIVGPKP